MRFGQRSATPLWPPRWRRREDCGSGGASGLRPRWVGCIFFISHPDWNVHDPEWAWEVRGGALAWRGISNLFRSAATSYLGVRDPCTCRSTCCSAHA